jgi:hypothetical protein
MPLVERFVLFFPLPGDGSQITEALRPLRKAVVVILSEAKDLLS